MDRPTNTMSYRSAVYSAEGMCATSQPLATLAGIEILKRGGSAADAAIGMLNTLAVVEPFMTGLGGDMFGLYFDATQNKLAGLNSSGPAPSGLDMGLVLSRGYRAMPERGPMTITVPGALAGLAAFHERYGSLAWEDLFQQAIEYAETGFPLSEVIAYQWKKETPVIKQDGKTADLYLLNGKTPKAGAVFRNRPLARSLKMIAKQGIGTFYQGELCDQICEAMKACGSPLSKQDMSRFTPEWVDPISVRYSGREIFELPPNTQGITVLEMLKLLDGFDLESMGLNSSEYVHTLVEAKKFCFFHRDTMIGDPQFGGGGFHRLLSDGNIHLFREQFDPLRASDFTHHPLHSNTVYATAVDKERNVASFISSIFHHFGSGIVAGETGILMQNRGSLFTLSEGHPNGLEPGKRPLQTIIPAMVFKNEKPELTFGVVGGHMQPQGHVQILNNIYVFGLGVQEASDQPRFFHTGFDLCLEHGFPGKIRRELMEKGHVLRDQVGVFGGFQGIWIDQVNGVLVGGSDLRKDGCVIGY